METSRAMSSDGSRMDQNKRTAGTWPSRIFLVGTLFGALMLRTQMVQNSFEAAQSKLTSTDLPRCRRSGQTRQLVANLPDKASDMGMVRSRDCVHRLSGYQSNKGGTQ
ncbi:MAG: hypothetical protein ACLS6O_01895 [Bifidobacterium sp.]